MDEHFFISYSSVDGADFSIKLADELAAGPPSFPVWIDKRKLQPGENWDAQIVDAIKASKAMFFVMTNDSVDDLSVCKEEWVRALKYKKPIIPLLVSPEAELPFRIGSREYINFTGDFTIALARLRKHLNWIDTPEGELKALKYRFADAQRDLKRAGPEKQLLIQEEINELRQQIEQLQTFISNPQATALQVKKNIEHGLERVRKPEKPMNENTQGKFINPPPLIAPTWFQDRHVETSLIGDFLKDEALRLMMVVGRGGIGKTAMVCRLLRSLENGQIPYEGGELAINGIVYLSDARSFHRINLVDLYSGLSKLLSKESKDHLNALYQNPKTSVRELIQTLTEAFPNGRTVVLLDNFEDELEAETGHIKSRELKEALTALLELPPHGLKIIITTRVAPQELAMVQPVLQRRLNLDTGLEHPYAENVLQAMDGDGKVGIKDASEELLTKVRERTRGFPRALEHLFAILSADRNTSLQEVLDNTEQLLPEQVMAVLVGEAFSRLDPTAQKVMQALAIYRYPVPPTAIDYLLQPFVIGVDSGKVLGRLVNMQFVHRDAGRYYLHQIDRDYALNRISEGKSSDLDLENPTFSQVHLQYRAAEWFKLIRKPREDLKELQDLSAQLLEFGLRCACKDYDTAAALLLEIDFDYLFLWGHYNLVIELHQRLQGKITDSYLKGSSVGNLGTAFSYLAQYEESINCYKQALSWAREQNDSESEGVWLGNLGRCYAEIGQTSQAIEKYEQSLLINREIKNRLNEAVNLGNLGNVYSDIGRSQKAIEYYKQALSIDRELENQTSVAHDLTNLGNSYAALGKSADAIRCYQDAFSLAKGIGYRLIEAGSLTNLGYLYLDHGKWKDAIQQFTDAIEIADNITNPQSQKHARMGLVCSYLFQGKLKEADQMAFDALRFDFPLSNFSNLTLMAVVALLKGDSIKAKEVFETGIQQGEILLIQSPQLFDVLDIKGLALSGLALCGDLNQLSAAKDAYKAARDINSDDGVVHRVLRLFDTISKADTAGILAEVRPVAAGKAS